VRTPLPCRARLNHPDSHILELIRAGQHDEAIAAIRVSYQGRLFRLCASYFRGNNMEAEESLHESIVRIWHALPTYDSGRGALYPWMSVIARNVCLSELKRRARQARFISLTPHRIENIGDANGDLPEDSDEDAAALGFPFAHVPPAASTVAESNLKQLGVLVARLPLRYQEVINLIFIGDLSAVEIAELLGVPLATVKSRLRRATSLLLEKLRQCGLDDLNLWETDL